MKLEEIDYLIDLLLKARSEILDKQESAEEDDDCMDKLAEAYADAEKDYNFGK